MNLATRLLVLVTMSVLIGPLFQGCRAMRGVASTSYHVATQPVKVIRGSGGRPKPGTTTTTTTTVTRTTRTTASDVTTPGTPVANPTASPPRPGRLIGTSSPEPTPTATPAGTRSKKAHGKTKPSAPESPQASTEYPIAKAVPGKAGYVFSPFDPRGRYVDVSGYAPGSKVKDPWTDKIFIVP